LLACLHLLDQHLLRSQVFFQLLLLLFFLLSLPPLFLREVLDVLLDVLLVIFLLPEGLRGLGHELLDRVRDRVHNSLLEVLDHALFHWVPVLQEGASDLLALEILALSFLFKPIEELIIHHIELLISVDHHDLDQILQVEGSPWVH
jgi:hypothetical protein